MKPSHTISKKVFAGLFAGLVSLPFTCMPVGAQVLFNNGLTVGSGGVFDDPGATTFTEEGNIFTPTLSGTATTVVFNGAYLDNPAVLPTDNFTLSLYTGAGSPTGTPVTSTLSGLTRTAIGSNGEGTVYQYSGTLTTPFTLVTSSSYYLGFTNNDSPTESFVLEETASAGSATTEYGKAGGNFTNYSPESLAFELSDTQATPEPSTWALLLGGFGLLAFVRSRTRRTLS